MPINCQHHESMLSSSSYLFEGDGHQQQEQQQKSTSMALSQLYTRHNNFPPSLPPKAAYYQTGFPMPMQMHLQFSNTMASEGSTATRKTMKSNSIPISADTPFLWNYNPNTHNRNYVGRMSDSGLVAFTQTYPAQKRKFVDNNCSNPVMHLIQQQQQLKQSPQSYASSTASSPSSASSDDVSSSSSASLYFDPFYVEYQNEEEEEDENDSSADSYCSFPDDRWVMIILFKCVIQKLLSKSKCIACKKRSHVISNFSGANHKRLFSTVFCATVFNRSADDALTIWKNLFGTSNVLNVCVGC